MKEKEKCTMKAEDSNYGPVADNRCPFSEMLRYTACKTPSVKHWVICPCRKKPGKNGAYSCNDKNRKTETPSPHLVVRRHSSNARFIHIALVTLAENG